MSPTLIFWTTLLGLGAAFGGIPLYRMLRDLYVFLELPKRASRLQDQGNRAEAIRLLERVLATRPYTPNGALLKLTARVTLGPMYHADGRFEDAVRIWQDALQENQGSLQAMPGVEYDIRRRLADALESQGQTDAAQAEYENAITALHSGGARDAAYHEARAELRERQGHHSEAATEYRLALEQCGDNSPRNVRAHLGIRLSLALYNAGRFAEGLRWAEESIALGMEGVSLATAHRQAGLQCINLNRLDDAEAHNRRALAVSEQAGLAEEARHSRVQIAYIQMLRGDLESATASCREAMAEGGEFTSIPRSIVFTCLALEGRFEEGITLLQRSPEEDRPLVYAHYQRRNDAAASLTLAMIYLELDRLDEAAEQCALAREEFDRDDQLRLSCDATELWLAAKRHPADPKVVEDIHWMLRQLEGIALDQGSAALREPLSLLGQAAADASEFAIGKRAWEMYAESGLRPAYAPMYTYGLGRCYAGTGDRDTARKLYQEAVAFGDTFYFARRAREALASL